MRPTTPPEPASRRLFLALWPPADQILLLQRCAVLRQAQVGGRLIPAVNFHVTLLFLGQVDRPKEAALCGQLDALSFSACSVEFSHFATWGKGLQVLVSDQRMPELHRLQSALKAIADQTGIAVDGRPYTPHISLLRQADREGPADMQDKSVQRVSWRAGEIALVESTPHAMTSLPPPSHYRTLRRWSANGLPTPP